MKHCAAPACPFATRYGRAAEYADSVARCVDCGALLHDGPAPEPTPAPNAEPLPRASRGLWLRGGLTLLIAALAVLLQQLDLPTIRDPGFEVPSGALGPLAVGLGPLILGFGLVELVAALIPQLRPSRYAGPRGRSRLVAMSIAIGLGLTLITTTLTTPTLSYLVDLDIRLVSLLLAATPLLLYYVSRGVDRFGVGSGLAVILAALVVPDLVSHLRSLFDTGGPETSAAGEAALLLATAALALPVWWTCGPAGSTPGWVRRVVPSGPMTLPLSGGSPLLDLLLPLTVVTPLLSFFGYWLDLPAFLYTHLPVATPHLLAVGAAALLVGWLYNQPARVAAVLRGLSLHVGAGSAETPLRRALWRAVPLSALLVVAAVGLWAYGADHVAEVPPTVLELAMLVVVTLDLRAEWRARRALGRLGRAWCLHRSYAVAPVLTALEREGIDAFARNRHLRALLPFLASWAPIDILVRPGDVARAQAFLAARLGASGKLSRDAILDALS